MKTLENQVLAVLSSNQHNYYLFGPNDSDVDRSIFKHIKQFIHLLQRRIKRRHTVGGTKDAAKFTSWAQTENSRRPCKVFAADLSSQENVDQNLGRACQQRTDNRRFSLQELWLSQNLQKVILPISQMPTVQSESNAIFHNWTNLLDHAFLLRFFLELFNKNTHKFLCIFTLYLKKSKV